MGAAPAAEPVGVHARVVAWARSKVGEREVPLGSNAGPFVVECQRSTSLPGTGWPWCAGFARRGWQASGVEVPYTGASAYGLFDYYAKNLPKWVVPRSVWSDAKPGAFVVFNIGAGHVALLAQPIRGRDTTVTTIGGNESDSVRETTRALSVVRGIVDPPENPPKRPPLQKARVFEVATSSSGQRKLIYVSGGKAIGRKLERILNGKGRGGITITPRMKP